MAGLSFPRRAARAALMLVAVWTASAMTARAEDLGRDRALVEGFAAGKDAASPDVAAALERLAAASVLGDPFFAAADRIAREGSAAAPDGIPLPLAVAEYGLTRDINATLGQIEPGRKPSAAILGRIKGHVARIGEIRSRLSRARATTARDHLMQRYEALRLLALCATDAGSAEKGASALLDRILKTPAPESRAFAMALHALAWALGQSDPEDGRATDLLAGWFGKGRAVFPSADRNLAAAAVDVADRAQLDARPEVAIAAMRFAAPVLDTIPDSLVNIADAQDHAELVDELDDPGLAYAYRLRLFRGLVATSLFDEASRALLLGNYAPGDRKHPDATIAALGQALATLHGRGDARVRARLGLVLALLLERQGRTGEWTGIDALASASDGTRARIAKAGPADVAALIGDANRGELDPETQIDALALYETALALIRAGAPATDGDRTMVRIGLVRALDLNGQRQAAVRRLRTYAEEINRSREMDVFRKRWFFEMAADWAQTHGAQQLAGPYRARIDLVLTDSNWEKLDAALARGALMQEVWSLFSNAVTQTAGIGNPSLLRGKLDQYVPLYAGLLARAASSDPTATALFAITYARAVRPIGEARLADVALGHQDASYPLFCRLMVEAGDARFAARPAACGAAVSAPAGEEGAERRRLDAAMPDGPAVAEDEAAICRAFAQTREAAATLPLDGVRQGLWRTVDAVRRHGAEPGCAVGTGFGANGVLATLAETYAGPAPDLALALYGEAVGSTRSVGAVVAALAMASSQDRGEAALPLLRRALANRGLRLPLSSVLTQWAWPRARMEPLVRAAFPDRDSVLVALDRLTEAPAADRGDGQADDRTEAYDRGLAAAPAALLIGERDAGFEDLVLALKARTTPGSEAPPALLAAGLAALAQAWLIDARNGPQAAAALYAEARTRLDRARRSDLPIDVSVSVAELLRTTDGAPGTDALASQAAKMSEGLSRLRQKDWAERGTPLDALHTLMPQLASGCSRVTAGTVGLAGPFANAERAADVGCVDRAFALLAAGLRSLDMAAPDLERSTRDLADTQLLQSFRAILDAVGPMAVARIPKQALPHLAALAKRQRAEEQQVAATALLRRAAGRSGAGGEAGGPGHARQAWIAAGRRLHLALSSAAPDAEIATAAAEARAAWAALDGAGEAEDGRVRHPGRSSADRAATDWDAVRRALAPDEAVVVYLSDLCDAAAVLRRDGVTLVPLTIDAGALRAYRSSVDPGRVGGKVDVALGHRVYRALFSPLEPALAGAATVFLDLPPALTPLPFAALVRREPSGRFWSVEDEATPDWLGLHLSLQIVPDPAIVPLSRQAPRPSRPSRLLAAGDPVLPDLRGDGARADRILSAGPAERPDLVRASFERLPDAGTEIASVVRAAAPVRTEVLSGRDFVNSRLQATVSPAMTHLLFATHAATAPESDDAILVTSPLGGSEDGVMDSQAIKRLRIDADLVVLSACQTGIAPQGRSTFGALTDAFQVAGARRVVATLWKVVSSGEAAVTVRAMSGLFRDGRSPVAALGEAMRAAAQGREGRAARDPGVWASFILVGEP